MIQWLYHLWFYNLYLELIGKGGIANRCTLERRFVTAQKALNTDAYADRSKQWIWNTVSPASRRMHARQSFVTSVLQVFPSECKPALWQEIQQPHKLFCNISNTKVISIWENFLRWDKETGTWKYLSRPHRNMKQY